MISKKEDIVTTIAGYQDGHFHSNSFTLCIDLNLPFHSAFVITIPIAVSEREDIVKVHSYFYVANVVETYFSPICCSFLMSAM